MFVLGTAGHVDHGKSVLVHALTGIDPDRLPEEKQRGMTIDLGFAWFKLPSGREVSIVDVPGHEDFVTNMVAGVGGIDLALLIVAANEGVMPQTREHLDILDLLGVPKAIAVITKKDLVDEEWLSLVSLEIDELLRQTTLSGAPIVAVSALTGEGLAELASAIDKILDSTPPAKDMGRPRLPIDRVFTIAGAGTVVTGTLIGGCLSTGQEVEILPGGLKSRLRGLQIHKASVSNACPGSRVAANLLGLAASELKRGDVLTKPGWLVPTTTLSGEIRLLPHLRRAMRHNATVSFHSATSEVMARLRLLEKEELPPGEVAWAQFILAKPVAVAKGDRFIFRSSQETLGGGIIVEPHAKRHRRFRPAIIQSLECRERGTVEEVLMATLEMSQPLEMGTLIARSDLPPGEARPAIEVLIREGKILAAGKGEHCLLFTLPGWQRLAKKAVALVGDHHQRFPVRPGMPKVELGSKLKIDKTSSADLWRRLFQEGVLVEAGTAVRLPSHRVQLAPEQQGRLDAFVESLNQNPYTPPSDLIPEPDLLNLLVEQGRVVKVSDSVIFAAAAYDEMVARTIAYMKAQGKVTLAEVRDLFRTSRKYAQAFLEHLDEKRITRRVGDERVPGQAFNEWRERMGVEPTGDTRDAPRRI